MISLVMAAANGGEWVRQTVVSAHKSLTGMDHEVVVIDDQSNDGGTDGLEARVIRTERPTGCSGSRRLGYDHARGDVIMLTDPHCTFAGDCLAALAAHAINRRCVAVPKVYLEGHGWTVGGKLGIDHRGFRLGRVPRRRLRYPALWGSIYAARREIWETIGGWPVLPCRLGRWEQLTTLLLWRLGIRVMQCRDCESRHHRYRDRGTYPYSRPDNDESQGLHFLHEVATWETYQDWVPLIHREAGVHEYVCGTVEAVRLQLLLQAREVMTEREMLEHLPDRRKEDDDTRNRNHEGRGAVAAAPG